jgi:hypothetical protein
MNAAVKDEKLSLPPSALLFILSILSILLICCSSKDKPCPYCFNFRS